ncbi:MAG: N-6 DNA methylase [Crocinitomicaceae bacterium]|nr:N-6 DNA methylase [Crocinitomicaceae bacterium]
MTTEELKKLEDDLWTAATRMRADSDLKLSEFATPVLGLIFLKFADNKYAAVESEILAEVKAQENSRRQREIHEIAIEKCGFYLPDKSRYNYLLNLPEKEDIAKAIKHAMAEIEKYKPELKDTLPQDEYYDLTRTEKNLPKTLLKTFSDIPVDATGDIFGKIYEFFLGRFAMAEGQGGGEFFTPTSVVKYMVEVIEPYTGTIFDPACGSGGMFVQSSHFIDERKKELKNSDPKDLYVYGTEKTLETVRLAKMNIAVNGLRGSVIQANSYYEDPHSAFGKFDFVMANPPFNVKDVNYDRVKDDRRFNTYGIPQNKSKGKKKQEGDANLVPNANYMWINLFATSLKPEGRAALVMPNSASDARNSEADIRQTLIKKGLISQMVTLSSNMFSTVTLPASLWFFDKSKMVNDFESEKDNIKVLFVDARNVYRQIDRAHREFTQEQIWNLATITRLYNGDSERFLHLIHKYIQNIGDLLPVATAAYERYLSIHNQLVQGLEKWHKAASFNKEQQPLAEELLQQLLLLTLSSDKNYSAAAVAAEAATADYLKKNKVTNEAQHQVAEKLLLLSDAKKVLKKHLDKSFRSLEKLFKQAEKELRDKNDKNWKELISFRELNEGATQMNEHFNEAMNRDPQFSAETEGKSAFYFFKTMAWLQERFPEAKYEDVTGLCKVSGVDEIEEQDWSLNPGRYVGVVIEEDGMTEEEFNDEMSKLNIALLELNNEGTSFLNLIENNYNSLFQE